VGDEELPCIGKLMCSYGGELTRHWQCTSLFTCRHPQGARIAYEHEVCCAVKMDCATSPVDKLQVWMLVLEVCKRTVTCKKANVVE